MSPCCVTRAWRPTPIACTCKACEVEAFEKLMLAFGASSPAHSFACHTDLRAAGVNTTGLVSARLVITINTAVMLVAAAAIHSAKIDESNQYSFPVGDADATTDPTGKGLTARTRKKALPSIKREVHDEQPY